MFSRKNKNKIVIERGVLLYGNSGRVTVSLPEGRLHDVVIGEWEYSYLVCYF